MPCFSGKMLDVTDVALDGFTLGTALLLFIKFDQKAAKGRFVLRVKLSPLRYKS